MNSNENNIPGILKEIRQLADTAPDGIIAIKGHVIADRIEEAWKREREVSGNVAAMREAVVSALSLLDLKEGVPYKTISQKDIDFMKAALAAPMRNCDVGTAGEQYRRWTYFCKFRNESRTTCLGCPVYEEQNKGQISTCELVWAQMPYDEKKGDSYGNK